MTPNPNLVESHQRRVAVIALSATISSTPAPAGCTASTCSAAMISVSGSVAVSPSEASCTVTETMVPVSMSTPCSALWAKCVPTVLHLRDLRVRVLRRFPLPVDVFLFFRDRSNRANSARVGVSTPDASANR